MTATSTRPLNMRVSEESLAVFEQLRRSAGLSQPRMFARLMAEQAQRLRIAQDVDLLRRDGPDDDAVAIATWQATHHPDLGE